MASSTATSSTATTARPLDPLRQNKFTLHPADSLLSRHRKTSAFSSVRYNYKPKLSRSSTRTATVSAGEHDRLGLVLADRSGDAESRYTYAARRKVLKRSYALVFDQNDHTCTLEPLSSSLVFNIKSTPSEPSAAKLAERYPKLKPRSEIDEESSTATGDADLNGPADEANPYDFRHFLRQASRSASPDGLRSSANTPLNGPSRLTPLHRPNLGAASPGVTPRKSGATVRRPSPPAGTTLSKPKNGSAPKVRLERRATSRSQPSKKIKSITQPKKGPTVKSDYYVHSSSEDDLEPLAPIGSKSNHTNLKSGGLEIDMGDATPPRPQSRVSAARAVGTPAAGPISLRSAANSTAASPAAQRGSGTGSSLLRTKSMNDGQVIDFGDVSTAEISSDGDEGSANDDVDIEPMTLGSPAHGTSGRGTRDGRAQDDESGSEGDADADGDAENDADFADAFEDAIKEFEESEADTAAGPAGTNAAASKYESEESEEE